MRLTARRGHCFLADRAGAGLAPRVALELVILAVLVFMATLFVVTLCRHRRSDETLIALSQRLGLELKLESRTTGQRAVRVEGRREGRRVEIWGFTSGFGKKRRRWVAVGLHPQECGTISIRIDPRGSGPPAELPGEQEIRLGDRRFDPVWIVRTNRPDIFGGALRQEVRTKMLELLEMGLKGAYRLEGGRVMYVEEGTFADKGVAEHLELALSVLHHLVLVIEHHTVRPGAGDGQGRTWR